MRIISVDGLDGAGKTELLSRLHAYFTAHGVETIVTSDLAGTELGAKVRAILTGGEVDATPKAMMSLLTAARIENIEKVIKPALARNCVVLIDRFVDSTRSYQIHGFGGSQLDFETICLPPIDITPDLILLLDIAPELIKGRVTKRGALDAIEKKGSAFHERVRNGFLEATHTPGRNFHVIDATQNADKVFQDALLLVNQVMAPVMH